MAEAIRAQTAPAQERTTVDALCLGKGEGGEALVEEVAAEVAVVAAAAAAAAVAVAVGLGLQSGHGLPLRWGQHQLLSRPH